MVLTRQEKENLVIDLHEQGKNSRQIAQEVGISFRDIATIVRNAVKQKERENSISVSSQAYAMFSESKTPIQVAIKLNMREAEVSKLYNEFLNLSDLHTLSEAYSEINGNIRYFLELYRLTKAAHMNTQDIIRILEIANNHLPRVEATYRTLQREVSSLEAEKNRSGRTFWELKDQIWSFQNTRDSLRYDSRELGLEVTKLRIQKIRLEEVINKIQNDGVIHSKIKGLVKREVEEFLSDPHLIFKLTLEPLFKYIRKDPNIIPISCQKTTDYPAQLPDHISNIELVPGSNSDIDLDY